MLRDDTRDELILATAQAVHILMLETLDPVTFVSRIKILKMRDDLGDLISQAEAEMAQNSGPYR